MRVLGISAFYHDSAAALVENGNILAASQEERFTRLKHDARMPVEAIRYCLETHPGPVDAVVYYEKPLLKFERILKTALREAPHGFRAFAAALPDWMRSKLWVPLQIEKAFEGLGIDVAEKIHFTSHHEAHAASAFFPSPFEAAAVLTIDGVGEWATTSIAKGEGNRLERLQELHFPDSLGMLYSAFTYHSGFRVNSGEYKLMGLAPYGKPIYREVILRELIDLKSDGSFRLNPHYFGYCRGQAMTNAAFSRLFGGPPRKPESPVTQRECDLARSIQVVTEEVVLALARYAREATGLSRLCLAGGVALNCVANGRLVREKLFEEVWVQPASGDAGGALGAALAFGYGQVGWTRKPDGKTDSMKGAFLGPESTNDAIEKALREAGLAFEKIAEGDLPERVAKRVAEGAVVGYFQGRCEYGPRALGARSILGDARSPEMQRVMNLKIKFRESFRPFAPVVREERVSDYFEWSGKSPYMLFTAPLLPALRRDVDTATGDLKERAGQVRSTLPAITHVDFSARIQTVDAVHNPALYRVLLAFERLTGCGVMINTSFNVRGEPPVCAPAEAIAGFLETEMDVLVLGPYVVEKSQVPADLPSRRPRRHFTPD